VIFISRDRSFDPLPTCVINRFRLQGEQKVLVCCVHPSEPATLQCMQCTKASLAQSKSLHCTQKCFQDYWRYHVIMHQEAAAKPTSRRQNGFEEDESPFTFSPAKALRALDGNLGGAGTHPANYSNGYSSPVRMASHSHNQEAGDIWCEVGQGKTYTPATEDVGHILKIECVIIDGSTGRPADTPHQRQTSRVIPAPSPTPRRLVSVNSMEPVDTDGRTASSGTFTVLSYNVLSDLYATSEQYSYCPPWALAWTYRRQNLLREIVAYRADILCLQEVFFLDLISFLVQFSVGTSISALVGVTPTLFITSNSACIKLNQHQEHQVLMASYYSVPVD
jgi:CCR4-NOT transcription complex subunit 6